MFIEYVPKIQMNKEIEKSADRCTVVLGLGSTGLSCARFLHARGHRVVILDTRLDPPGLSNLRQTLPKVEVKLGSFNLTHLYGAEQLIVSPGVSLDETIVQQALDAGIPVLGDIELFVRECTRPVIAITGSNGKSTVTTWLAAVLSKLGKNVLAGGNLAPPALDLLLEPEPDYYVLELSSFQLESTVSLKTTAAAVLNLSPDHIDRHGSLSAYAKAKARILRNCEVAVLNRDDPMVMGMDTRSARVITFGLSAPVNEADYGVAQVGDSNWIFKGAQSVMPVSDIPLTGRHNWINAMAVLAMAESLNVPLESATKKLKCFRGLPHRMQLVGERDGVTWIDDSKGTNVGATVAAIEGCEGPLVLIAGGDGKNADFAPLAAAVKDKVKASIVLGKDASVLRAVLEPWCPVVQVPDMEQAVVTAARLAATGDTVLLSPACASLDMFKDYSERGRVFVSAFKDLDHD